MKIIHDHAMHSVIYIHCRYTCRSVTVFPFIFPTSPARRIVLPWGQGFRVGGGWEETAGRQPGNRQPGGVTTTVAMETSMHSDLCTNKCIVNAITTLIAHGYHDTYLLPGVMFTGHRLAQPWTISDGPYSGRSFLCSIQCSKGMRDTGLPQYRCLH